MNSLAIRRFAVSCILGTSLSTASVFAQNTRAFYISFTVPGSVNVSPHSINNFSTVAGSFTDTNKISHGFLRQAFGEIRCFDYPGSVSTTAAAINDDGTIIGTYVDTSNVSHGYLRHPRGAFTAIDVAGATSTVPTSINAFGAIAGYYFSSGVSQSFVRSPEGKITVFGPTNSHAESINLFGAIAGFTEPPSTGIGPPQILVEGFVRSPEGAVTLFADPSASSNGTYAEGIDAFGGVSGFYQNSQDVSQGFVRSPEGTFTSITEGFQSAIIANNELGATVGYYNLFEGPEHGFVRSVKGKVTSFDFPGGATYPTSMNDFGVIVGSNGNFGYGTIGFLRVPY